MSQTEPSATPHLTAVPLAELQSAYPTSELLSRPILNRAGENVGRIEDLLMKDDHLAFAIVDVGEFVGAPGRRVIVAFEDLSIVDKEFMIADATPEDETTCADALILDEGFRAQRAAPPSSPPAGVRAGAAWTIHTADNRTDLPGTPVRSVGDPESGDEAVDEAAHGVEGTLALIAEIYGRASFDDQGAPVIATVEPAGSSSRSRSTTAC